MAVKVSEKLRKEREQDKGKEDFFVQTFEEVIAVFANIINILNIVLVMIALISVVVSAVNIANSMYTAVLERTNEIGVMKAIGARNATIQYIFLVESGLLGLAGGALGIFFGYLVATAGGNIAAAAGYSMLQPYFPWWLIAGCLMFSFLVGMLSGYFPAKQASKLKPVDALRYE
jgi:putative ABC transport system permease protein